MKQLTTGPKHFLQTQFFPVLCISIADIKHHPKHILPALVSNTNVIAIKQTKTYASVNIANECYQNYLCVGTAIIGRSKKCCTLSSSVSNLLPCRDSLVLTVCLPVSVCISFKVLLQIWGTASGYARGHAWGRAVVQSPILVSGRALGKSDVIKMQF